MNGKRGSVTVIALVFLLFLAILAGSWIIMMTQEKTNAMTDQKQQQAWYAAEAGYKRALTQIKQKNSDWTWLTSATNFNAKKYKFWNLHKLQELGTGIATEPVYAVYISNISTRGTGITIASGTKYDITSIGEYMGERKVISRSYTTDSTTDSGGTITENPITTTASNALVVAKGQVTLQGAGNSASSGNIYSNATAKITSNKGVKQLGNYTGAGLNLTSLTIPDEVFSSNKYKNAMTTVDYINSQVTQYGGYTIQGGAGTCIYIKGGGTLNLLVPIVGPTDDSDDPLTIVTDGDLKIDGAISGRVRILAKGEIYLPSTANVADYSKLMLAANGGLRIYRSIIYGLLISAGNIAYNDTIAQPQSYYFYGQILSEGSVVMHLGYTEYSDAVALSTGFTFPTTAVTGS